MKKFLLGMFFFSLTCLPLSYAANESGVSHFHGEGTVTSVEPVYSRITIEHLPIKGFASANTTSFAVSSPTLLKKISTSDLVSFDIEDTNGDAQIVKIERTGQALPIEDGLPLGRAAQDLLEGAGAVVKTVASPIAPVSEVANATTDATTNATGSVLNDGKADGMTKF